MEVTQVFDPFNYSGPSPKIGLKTVVIVMAILGAIWFFLDWQRKNSLKASGFAQ